MEQAKVTLGGSYRKHFPRIWRAVEEFRAHGAQLLRPHTAEISSTDGDIVKLAGDPLEGSAVERPQFDAIASSYLFYIVNPGGYVGPSATAHAGFAASRGVAVVCSEPPYERTIEVIMAGVGSPSEAMRLLAEREQDERRL